MMKLIKTCFLFLVGFGLLSCASAQAVEPIVTDDQPWSRDLEKVSKELKQQVDELQALLEVRAMTHEIEDLIDLSSGARRSVRDALTMFRTHWLREDGSAHVSSSDDGWYSDVRDLVSEALSQGDAKKVLALLKHRKRSAEATSERIGITASLLGEVAGTVAREAVKSTLFLTQDEEDRAKGLEKWGEEYGRKWEEWAERYAEEWEEWAEDNEGVWEDWAARFENDFIAWGERQEVEWEAWAERYSGQWEAWAERIEKEFEDGDPGAFGSLLEGVFKNLEGLSDMPLEGLDDLPLDGLADLPFESLAQISEMDWDGFGELIEESIENSLKGLEALNIEEEGFRGAIEAVVNELTKTSLGLRTSKDHKRHSLEKSSKEQWKTLYEALSDKKTGKTQERSKTVDSIGERLEELIKDRIAEIHRHGDRNPSARVERLKREQKVIEVNDRELRELRDEIRALKREIKGLKRKR